MALAQIAVTPSGLNAGGHGNGVSVTVPVNNLTLAANDILFIAASTYGQDTLSIDQGFAAVLAGNVTASGSFYLWWKRTTGTETEPIVSGASNSITTQVLQVRGARNTGNPWQVVAGSVSTGSSNSHDAAAITTRAASSLVIQAYACRDDNVPNGATLTNYDHARTNSGNDCSCGFAWNTQANAGTTGTCSVTTGFTDPWQTYLLAIDPPLEIAEGATAGTATARSDGPSLWSDGATASDTVRAKTVASAGVSASATASDAVYGGYANYTTSRPSLLSVSPNPVSPGTSLTVKGHAIISDLAEGATAGTATARNDPGEESSPYSRSQADGTTAADGVTAVQRFADPVTASATPGTATQAVTTAKAERGEGSSAGSAVEARGTFGASLAEGPGAESAFASKAIGSATVGEAATASDGTVCNYGGAVQEGAVGEGPSASAEAAAALIEKATLAAFVTPADAVDTANAWADVVKLIGTASGLGMSGVATATLPAFQADDIVVVHAGGNVGTPTGEYLTIDGTGWTNVIAHTTDLRLFYVWWRRISTGDPTSVTITSSSVARTEVVAGVWRFCRTTGSPFDVIGAEAYYSAASHSIPSITTTIDNTRVLLCGINGGGSYRAQVSGLPSTEAVNEDSRYLFHGKKADYGAIGNTTVTWSDGVSHTGVAAHLALTPAWQNYAATAEAAAEAADALEAQIVNRLTKAPTISVLSPSQLQPGAPFTVSGEGQPTGTENANTIPRDSLLAQQTFAAELAESITAAMEIGVPVAALVLPTTLEAGEASALYLAAADGDDSLIETGGWVEWTVQAPVGTVFTVEFNATSMEGAKVQLVVDTNPEQTFTVYSDEEEEEERA